LTFLHKSLSKEGRPKALLVHCSAWSERWEWR